MRIGANSITVLSCLTQAVIFERGVDAQSSSASPPPQDLLTVCAEVSRHCYNQVPDPDVIIPRLLKEGVLGLLTHTIIKAGKKVL